MINAHQRALAARIKEGCPVSDISEPVPGKTEQTGYLAEMLAGISFDAIAEDLAATRERTSRALMRTTQSSVSRQVSAVMRGYRHAPRLNELYVDLAERTGKRAVPLPQRLNQGAGTAVTSLAITLDTLIVRTRSGEPLTRRGLRESQRVPFALAMSLMKTLSPTYDRIERDATRREQDAYGIGRTVLKDWVATMTPTQGLALKSEFQVTQATEDPADPHLGCPVTLIPDFVRNLYVPVAEAAIEKGILSVTD